MTRNLVDDCFRPGQPRLRHDEAVALLQSRLSVLCRVIDVPVFEACGLTLAHAVTAKSPVPAHTNSAVDGYAFCSTQATRGQNTTLEITGRAAAGRPLTGAASPDTATRIFTGAVLPQGLDTVVMQEDVSEQTRDGEPAIAIPPGLAAGSNVRKAGEDVAAGTALFAAGDILRPQDLAALASIGRDRVACYEPLRVAIVSTGDEIVRAGEAPLLPGQVYDANAPMLGALAGLAGTRVDQLGIWPDILETVTSSLARAATRFDVILTSGGASLGEEDHMARALGAIGTRHLWQLAVKPGRPMMFGQIRSGDRDTVVIGLPGNPVAVFVCFLMYVYPLLRAAGGARWPEPRRFMLPSTFAFEGRKKGRREFWRGKLVQTPAGLAAAKFARDGSGLISGLRASDGLIDIPEDRGDIAAGDLVAFIPYSEFGIV